LFESSSVHQITTFRRVAQPGSASGLGPEGPRFKSLYADQFCRVEESGRPRQSHTLEIAVFESRLCFHHIRNFVCQIFGKMTHKDSCLSKTKHKYADLAQLVEQPPCKRQVVCSIQTIGTKYGLYSSVVERRLDKAEVVGPIPTTGTTHSQALAQRIERGPPTSEVGISKFSCLAREKHGCIA
jgi:hypothetical protein